MGEENAGRQDIEGDGTRVNLCRQEEETKRISAEKNGYDWYRNPTMGDCNERTSSRRGKGEKGQQKSGN